MAGPNAAWCSLLLALLFYSASPLLLANGLVDYVPEDLHSESRLLELFERWNDKHGKVYLSSAAQVEKQRRYEIFKENLRYIHQHNQGPASYKLGLTRFADLTNREFKASKFLGGLRPGSQRREHAKVQEMRCTVSALPSAYDWREQGVVVPIKDQGICGSCWAFATIAAIESINAIVTGDLVSLSEQELVSCDDIDQGCNGGEMHTAFKWVIDNGGVHTESDYPYSSINGQTGSCLNSLVSNKKVVTIDSYANVTSYDKEALQCVVSQQPVIVRINGGAKDFQLYIGGVFNGTCPGELDDLNHEVVIVGWGSSEEVDYWIARNSWGSEWGKEGYIYMIRNIGDLEGICGMYNQPSYPIKISA